MKLKESVISYIGHVYVVVVSFPDPPGWPGNETNIVAVNPFEF